MKIIAIKSLLFIQKCWKTKDFLDSITKENKLNLTFIYDDFDRMC